MLMALVALCGRVQAVGVLWHQIEAAAGGGSTFITSALIQCAIRFQSATTRYKRK